MRNKLVTIITLVAIVILGFTGCTNGVVKKSIEQAKSEIESKEYDKALASLQSALNEDSKNEEANKLYSIVNDYKKAKGLVDENKLHDAKKVLAETNADYINYGIKGDIDSLKKEVEDKLKQMELFNNNLEKLSGLVDEKSYDKANTLIDEINKGSLSEEQKGKVSELKIKVESELAKIEAQKKAEEEAKKKAEKAVKQVEEKKKSSENITEDKAIDLVAKYLKSKGKNPNRSYMLDSDTNTEYTFRFFDDMGEHIVSSEWYTVNKKTGSIREGF